MAARAAGSTIEILMVDDDPGDIRITTEALKDSKLANRVSAVNDGEQAMMYLRREGAYANATRPDLVLLDINMPRKNGHETLSEIRADPKLTGLPVVMLTTSNANEDIKQAYEGHANCYVTKPGDLDKFVSVVQKVEDFWVSTVSMPRRQ